MPAAPRPTASPPASPIITIAASSGAGKAIQVVSGVRCFCYNTIPSAAAEAPPAADGVLTDTPTSEASRPNSSRSWSRRIVKGRQRSGLLSPHHGGRRHTLPRCQEVATESHQSATTRSRWVDGLLRIHSCCAMRLLTRKILGASDWGAVSQCNSLHHNGGLMGLIIVCVVVERLQWSAVPRVDPHHPLCMGGCHHGRPYLEHAWCWS